MKALHFDASRWDSNLPLDIHLNGDKERFVLRVGESLYSLDAKQAHEIGRFLSDNALVIEQAQEARRKVEVKP